MSCATTPQFEWSKLKTRVPSVVMLVIAAMILLAACSGSDADSVATQPAEQPPTVDAAVPTTGTDQQPTTPATDAPTEVPALAPARCEDVPAFSAADTVSIGCAGPYAVSPEMFVNSAGWHLLQGDSGQWAEIDYARTCCDAADVTFVQLLGRNGLDADRIAQLCALSGLAADPSTGCVAGGGVEPDPDFEGTWLRVNGLGGDDFGTAQNAALASIEAVFGPPQSLTEASECGAGPMMIASFDDFTVQFQNDQLIGWYYVSSAPALTTPSGVAVGISEGALEQVYQGLEITEGSLGREFIFTVPAGFMAGFIDQPGGSVVGLYAGTTCFFR